MVEFWHRLRHNMPPGVLRRSYLSEYRTRYLAALELFDGKHEETHNWVIKPCDELGGVRTDNAPMFQVKEVIAKLLAEQNNPPIEPSIDGVVLEECDVCPHRGVIEQRIRATMIKPIKTITDYNAVVSRIYELLDVPENTAGADEREVLLTLVMAYDSKHGLIDEASTKYKIALELFDGDHDAAIRWLSTPAKALDGVQAWNSSVEKIQELAGRIEHGLVT